MPRRMQGDAAAPWDSQLRTRIIRQYFMDSIPTERGIRSAGAIAATTFLGGAVNIDTSAGAGRQWHFFDYNHQINDFWEWPQEVLAFVHGATFANAAGVQSVGIAIGGSGTVNDGGESGGLGLMALRYRSPTQKWQLRVWDSDGNSLDTDCTLQPAAPAGVWLRMLYIPRGGATNIDFPARAPIIQCWVGNPPVLIHTQSDLTIDGIGGGSADFGVGVFALAGSNAAGRVSSFIVSHFHGISHMNMPGGVLEHTDAMRNV